MLNDEADPYGYKLSTTRHWHLPPTPSRVSCCNSYQHILEPASPVLTKALKHKAAKITLKRYAQAKGTRLAPKRLPDSQLIFEAPYVSPRIFRLVTEHFMPDRSFGSATTICPSTGKKMRSVNLSLYSSSFDGYDDIRQLRYMAWRTQPCWNTRARIPQKFNLSDISQKNRLTIRMKHTFDTSDIGINQS